MVDHTKSTGGDGTMLIRDSGGYVELWLRAGSQTFNYDLPWAYTINGSSSGWKQFRFEPGGDYQRLGRAKVSYSQTVTFKIGDSGTAGLGGPTTFSVSINRSKKPNAPYGLEVHDVTSTGMRVTFIDGANNGDSIDARQIGVSTSPTGSKKTIASDGNTNFGSLTPGTTYYIWARTHNSVGWSIWSTTARSATTLSVVRVRVGGVWETATPYVKVSGVWKLARPWSRVAGVWKEAK